MRYLGLLLLSSLSFGVCDIPNALQTLRPKAQWNLRGTDYSGIEWLDKVQTMPSQAEVAIGISQCQANQVTLAQQIQSDLVTINSSTGAVTNKVTALIDFLSKKGLLQ